MYKAVSNTGQQVTSKQNSLTSGDSGGSSVSDANPLIHRTRFKILDRYSSKVWFRHRLVAKLSPPHYVMLPDENRKGPAHFPQ